MAKVKYILLIPLTYNDGSKVPLKILTKIRGELYRLGGGYHSAGVGEGAYRMKSGKRQVDRSIQYWVVIDEKKEPALKNAVVGFADILEQEAIYLERVHSTVEFVAPRQKEKRRR